MKKLTNGAHTTTRLLFIMCFALLCCGSLDAQTAVIGGHVTDQTGAPIPGAKVTATNTATAVGASTLTTNDGNYTLPFLQPGVYNIAVAKTGFASGVRRSIKLDVDQTAKINFALQVGSVSQTVEVSGQAPLLQSQDASVGQVIENKTIVTLPLNGRDYTQLVTLSAGAAPNPQSRASNGFSLNGGTTFQTEILLEGTDNTNREIGIDSHNINVLQPSVDAIREFKVETADYSAQYGHSAGGLVISTLKSGTNQFHGDAFEFLRNNDFDARGFFANRNNLPTPALRRNQFGGTLGGPILRNRLFFFVSYQGTRQASETAGTTTVPTPEEVQGNFGSIKIYNPYSVVGGKRQPFPQNTIPAGLLDPVGAKLAALYPLPNQPGLINNYAYNQGVTDDADEVDSRFDGQISRHDQAFFSFSHSSEETDTGSWFAPPGNGGSGIGNQPNEVPVHAYLATIGETHIFTPTMVNDLHLAYTHLDSNELVPATKPLFDEFGFQGIPQLAGLDGLPRIVVTGFSNLGDRTWAPNYKLLQEGQINDVASWVRGNHTITFGGEWIDTHNDVNSWNLPRGQFSFSGQFTSQTLGKGRGSAVADLLLGQTSNAGIGTVQVANLRNYYYGLFLNDSWKVTPKLTLNLGVRYDLQTPWWERDNRMSNFVVNPYSPDYGQFVQAKPGSYLSRTFSKLDTNNFAPRVGFAYQLTRDTVLRSGFGIFYGNWGYTGNTNSGSANPPFLYSVTLASSTTDPLSSVLLSQGFPPGFLSPAHVENPDLYSVSADYPMPMVAQWNFAVQQQLPDDSTVTVAYVGSSSSHLAALDDVNAPPPGPGAINPRRIWPQYGEFKYETPYAHATYHSLQLTFQHRFDHGFSVLADYAWSKSLDNVLNNEDGVGGAYPQDPNDWAAEKAPSGFDVPQRFVASVIYKLPFDSPKTFIGRNRVGRMLLGGWQIGAIFTAQTGFFQTPGVSPNPANTTTPARPDRACDGNLPSGQRTIEQWYQVSCFAPATGFRYGNSARQVIVGPGLTNLDALLDRSFLFTESKKLEFRAEFFNAANFVNFDAPNMTVTNPQAGTITGARPARIIQLALKFVF